MVGRGLKQVGPQVLNTARMSSLGWLLERIRIEKAPQTPAKDYPAKEPIFSPSTDAK